MNIPHLTVFIDYGETYIRGRQRKSRWAFGVKEKKIHYVTYYIIASFSSMCKKIILFKMCNYDKGI